MKDKEQEKQSDMPFDEQAALKAVEELIQKSAFFAKMLIRTEKLTIQKHRLIFDMLKGLGTKNTKILAQYCGLDPKFYQSKPDLLLAIMRSMSVEQLPARCHEFK